MKYKCWADIIRDYKNNKISIEQFFAELEKYNNKIEQEHIQFEYFRKQLQEFVDSGIDYLSEAACQLADAIEQKCWDDVPSPAEIEEEKRRMTGEGYIIIGKYRHNVEY